MSKIDVNDAHWLQCRYYFRRFECALLQQHFMFGHQLFKLSTHADASPVHYKNTINLRAYTIHKYQFTLLTFLKSYLYDIRSWCPTTVVSHTILTFTFYKYVYYIISYLHVCKYIKQDSDIFLIFHLNISYFIYLFFWKNIQKWKRYRDSLCLKYFLHRLL